LYIDNDQKVIDGSAQLAPITQGKLKEALESGAFMVNYVGHGNERVLAREYVVDFPFIDGLKNRYKLPVMVTATCEFGRYDEPMLANGVSGGERLLLNPEGGAIALLTTTRPVYAFSNFYVNSAFHEHLFDKEGTDYVRLGDIVRLTKNNSLSGVNNRNFALLGDPMLRLAYPRQHVQITEINQRPFVESVGDTLGALEYVQLKGSVVTQAGQPLSGFEGSVFMEVYDRETDRYTLGQENNPFAYKVRENRLFRGEASVVNGNFQFEFILPKNISYLYEPGKITFYAQANNFRDDATGAYTSVRIGGSSPTAQAENQPPKIEMYINDPTFKDGSTVGSSGLLIARVTDESGINISGLGISQDIVLQLNEQTHVLNNYYTAARDTYKEGFIVFPFNGLEPGRYNARLKVWDIHNNLSESEVGFIVSDQPKIRLYNVMCYPNPVQDKVFFRFEHDRIGEALLVNVEFYDLSGKLIQRSSFEFDDSSRLVETPVIETLPGRMQNGIYLFRLKVVSSTHPAMGEEAGKIIIMN
ncbi:MAG: type IX secretion system sortase PorU, partial [Cyclobacteriaceae bacterium]|nr:type IX secretion system sortase PorU [Cyclobacteriaceae bacterium]